MSDRNISPLPQPATVLELLDFDDMDTDQRARLESLIARSEERWRATDAEQADHRERLRRLEDARLATHQGAADRFRGAITTIVVGIVMLAIGALSAQILGR